MTDSVGGYGRPVTTGAHTSKGAGPPGPPPSSGASALGEDHRVDDLVGEGLPAGVPKRPQVAEHTGDGIQHVGDVADEAHKAAERLGVHHADQAEGEGLSA